MPGQPPQAYADAYWADVAEELEQTHHVPPNEIPAAIAEFRQHMAPAGQTIYNDDPAEIAATMVGHGYFDSVPAVGLCLQVVFKLLDADDVLTDPTAAAKSAAGFIDALDEMERVFGGEGLTLDEAEAVPGYVVLSLKPVQALGAAERLARLAEEVQQASKVAADADVKLTAELRKRTGAGEQVFVTPHYKAA